MRKLAVLLLTILAVLAFGGSALAGPGGTIWPMGTMYKAAR